MSNRFSPCSEGRPPMQNQLNPPPSGWTTMKILMPRVQLINSSSRWSTVQMERTWASAEHWILTNIIRLMDLTMPKNSKCGCQKAFLTTLRLHQVRSLMRYAMKHIHTHRLTDLISVLKSTNFRLLENLALHLLWDDLSHEEAKNDEL